MTWCVPESRCLRFCLSNIQEDVRAEAEGTAEAVRQAAEETQGAEGRRQVHQAGGKDTTQPMPRSLCNSFGFC